VRVDDGMLAGREVGLVCSNRCRGHAIVGATTMPR
jgi:hypothetical protein